MNIVVQPTSVHEFGCFVDIPAISHRLMSLQLAGTGVAGHMAALKIISGPPLSVNSTLRTIAPYLTILSFWVAIHCVRVQPQLIRPDSGRVSAQEEIDSTWRRTRSGWQDSIKWNRPRVVTFERRIELVHPLTFSAMMVMFSVGVLIWASEEYHWAQLLKMKEPTLKEKLERAKKDQVRRESIGLSRQPE